MDKCSNCSKEFSTSDMCHITYCYSKTRTHGLCATCCVHKALIDYETSGIISTFSSNLVNEATHYYKDYPSTSDLTLIQQTTVELKRNTMHKLINIFNGLRIITRLIETRLVWGLTLKEALFYGKFYARFMKVVDAGELNKNPKIARMFDWLSSDRKLPPYFGKLFNRGQIIGDDDIEFGDGITFKSGHLCRCYIKIKHKDFDLSYIMDDSSSLPRGGIAELYGKADIMEEVLTDFLVRGIDEWQKNSKT